MKNKLFKWNVILLTIIGALDIFRGFMHTFNINWASANIAKIDQSPDAMILMGAFGISNFLTGFIYFTVVKKSKELAPYIVGLIPLAYILGLVGLNISGVHMDNGNAAWNGKFIMLPYLAICLISSAAYFIVKDRKK